MLKVTTNKAKRVDWGWHGDD